MMDFKFGSELVSKQSAGGRGTKQYLQDLHTLGLFTP